MMIDDENIYRSPEEKYLALMDKLGVKVIGETIDSECEAVTQIDTLSHTSCIERVYSDGSSEKGNYVNGGWTKDEAEQFK